jgi:cytoskeletal protein RodZ
MKRASDLFQTSRLDRELDIGEISKKTKIPAHYLSAFENEDIASFPEEPYCSLMVKEYANFLGLNGDDVLCLFRRDHHRQINSIDKSPSSFSITPHTTYSFLVIGLVILFSIYLVTEYFKFQKPPILKITWPEKISEKTLIIECSTDPESTVKINDDLVLVDQNGLFKKTIEVSSSESKIVVESISPAGISTIAEKKY